MILPDLNGGIIELAGSKIGVLIAVYIGLKVVFRILKSGSRGGYSKGKSDNQRELDNEWRKYKRNGG